MRYTSTLVALAASVSTVSAVAQGFNYGATKSDGSFMYEADFKAKFVAAQNLVGTSGFTSARLYTTIQGGSSTNDPIEAIPAAIASDTTLLLGIWASGGQNQINAELIALNSAISKWGTEFTKRVIGISVGSEDLYRISPTGLLSGAGTGADPDTLVSYIKQVRSAISGTGLSAVPIGHVDTWTAWANSSNSAVAEALDWVGMDAYPYFQNTQSNGIENGKSLFDSALSDVKNAVGGKPVWVTETGWPTSGSSENLGVASTENAKTYWDQVGCPLFGSVNTFWYTLQDEDTSVAVSPHFGIVGSTLSTTPLFDLSCKDVSSSSSSASATAGSSSTSGSASAKPTSSSGSSEESSAAASSTATGSDSTATSGAASSSSTGSTDSGSGAASSGSGLSPSHGGAAGSIATLSSTVLATATGSGGNSSVSSSPTPSASTTGTIVNGNGASELTGSFIAAFGAIIAAVAAL